MTFPVLAGKVAIVTGAAMGMGEATAESIKAEGGEAAFVKVDVSNADDVQKNGAICC